MSAIPTPAIQTSSPPDVVSVDGDKIEINASGDIGVASLSGLPENYRISMKIVPEGNYEEAGLFLRATDKRQSGYRLELNPDNQIVTMHNTSINAVNNLEKTIPLEVIVYD